MICEYDMIVTVEVQGKDDDMSEQRRLIKKFKNELYQRYAGDDITRITEIKREGRVKSPQT